VFGGVPQTHGSADIIRAQRNQLISGNASPTAVFRGVPETFETVEKLGTNGSFF